MEQAMQTKAPDGVPRDGNRFDVLLLAGAFALLNAAQWLTRVVLTDTSLGIDYAGRILAVLLFFAVFCSSWRKAPDIFRIALGAIASFIVAPLISLAMWADPAPGEEVIVLTCMQYAASSLGFVLCLSATTVAFGQYGRVGIGAMVGSWLGAQVLFFVFSYAPTGVIELVRPGLRLASSLLLCAYLLRCRNSARQPQTATSHPDCGGMSQTAPDETPVQTAGKADFALLLATAAFLPFLFCTVSQFLGSNGFEDSLYEPSSEIGAIGLLVCLLVGREAWARRLNLGLVWAVCIPLFATGYLMLPVDLVPGTLLSRLFIKLAFVLFQVSAFILLIGVLRARPDRSLAHAGLFWGVFQASKVAGRGLVIYTPALQPGASDHAVWLIAMGGLYMLGLFGAICAVVLYARSQRREDLAPALGGGAPTQREGSGTAGPVSSFAEGNGLSERETDVLSRVIRGYGVKEIADSLSVSQGTVKTHLHNMYRKCGVSDRQELIRLFEHRTGQSDPNYAKPQADNLPTRQ